MRTHKLTTHARMFYHECARLWFVRAHLCTDLHEIWNLSSQDSNWPPYKISWRSKLSLRRYLQNKLALFNPSFSIYFSYLHNLSTKVSPKFEKYDKCLGYLACGKMICLFILVTRIRFMIKQIPISWWTSPKNYVIYFWTPCLWSIGKKGKT